MKTRFIETVQTFVSTTDSTIESYHRSRASSNLPSKKMANCESVRLQF